MKFISVSEAALDSIQRMGEADKARIAELEAALERASDSFNRNGLYISAHHALAVARVSTDVQTIAKDEN